MLYWYCVIDNIATLVLLFAERSLRNVAGRRVGDNDTETDVGKQSKQHMNQGTTPASHIASA